MSKILCTWLREVCSCCSLTVLPGPAWVLLNNVLQRILLISVKPPSIPDKVGCEAVKKNLELLNGVESDLCFLRKCGSQGFINLIASLEAGSIAKFTEPDPVSTVRKRDGKMLLSSLDRIFDLMPQISFRFPTPNLIFSTLPVVHRTDDSIALAK